jgi:cell division initiation protein
MPRLTPLEIQKHEFTTKWKGLDRVEVESFLSMIAEETEDLARTNSELEGRVRQLLEENEEHRERERILRATLLTAQRASEDIRTSAQKDAERIVQEAQEAGERLTHSALQRSAEIEKAIQELKIQRVNFRLQLQKMIELFQQVLDFDREEGERDRPVSYLTRKPEKEEGAL